MESKTKIFSILSQLKTLEMQVTGLRIQVQQLVEQEYGPLPTFADLHGILEGQCSSSEEDIDAVLYKMTPEFEEEIATLPAPVSKDAAP